jgi:putative spermidine/putrescine transport system substrate-binding protein
MRKEMWALVVALPAAGAMAMETDLTVISFGHADQQALTSAYYQPFSKATGIGIKAQSYDGETTELVQMAKSGKPYWDVVQVESRTLELGCRDGLFEKLDHARVARKADFIPGSVSECGVPIFAWSMALAYDSGKLAMAPRSWADFWNTAKFPGKRGLRRSAKYTLEIALLADGVASGDVYKVLATKAGVDRAFRKLGEIKDDVIWWQAAADPALFLSDGRFVMTSAYTLWIDRERQQKKNVAIAWNGSLYDVDSWAIPKGSSRMADAYRFMAFASEPAHQAALSRELAYGPSNRKAFALQDPGVRSRMPSSDEHLKQALRIDTAFWIEHGAELERRFDAWAPQPCIQEIEDHGDEYTEQAECQDAQGNLRHGDAKHGEGGAHPHDHGASGHHRH